MQQTCQQCAAAFEITDGDLAFYKKISPVFQGKTYSVPPPTLCPDCRLQRRLVQCNECKLFRRPSSKSGKDIVSAISPESPYLVFEAKEWWADDWDPLAYGRQIETDTPVFGQLETLFRTVPLVALVTDANENSEYVHYSGWDKNCYLCFCTDYSQDCLFCYSTYYAKDTMDCYGALNAELCYACVHCKDCYALQYSESCADCSESAWLYDCSNCKNCFGCVGLRQKQYCFFNEQLTQEEYEKRMMDFPSSLHSTKARVTALRDPLLKKHPRKAFIGQNNEQVSGDHLTNSKNALQCFDSDALEDSKFCDYMRNAKDCYDVYRWGHAGELCYECIGVGAGATNMLFCFCCWPNNSNLLYSSFCNSCHDCFGCAGLRHKSYCIFNRQYSKEEYEKIVPTLIESMIHNNEWGEFFPVSFSAFAYNDSAAQWMFPLSKEEVLKRGWRWSEYENPLPVVQKIIAAADLPDSIDDIPDDILNWAIKCEATGKPFKIVKQELDYYRTMKLPVPRRHPDQRHTDRMAQRNPHHLWSRNCDNCQKPIQTTYAPDRPEIVFCEDCYLKEVY